ncbi:FlgN protein [Pseudobythopirellula maris]|uniref:FlgN protein n=2 Tax=Pseudobythopirellula maris TaxID=2527991 RepID=A0A5C5ZM50_9BACT|nr:FlgN protein [Pseudobythopirellula maris]
MKLNDTAVPVAADELPSPAEWERRIGDLLERLSTVQKDLLSLLAEKGKLLANRDTDGLKALQSRETRLSERLATLHAERERLLVEAEKRGKPARDLQALSATLPAAERRRLRPRIREARGTSRLLHHHSLASWVLVQRQLLHVSQMIEIVATGGKKSPTYLKSGLPETSGALVDRAV